jgi:hypothetical protein
VFFIDKVGGFVMDNEKELLSIEKCHEILEILETRFEQNLVRHKEIQWDDVKRKLTGNNEKLRILYEMETTGGEPDVVFYDTGTDEYLFFDCSAESPNGRRNICYDREALDGRKENKPQNSALDMASAMGIEILTEQQYRELQKLGKFDTKTSSWVKTPDFIRKLGGAIFCDRRYDTVFVYHNGAESYYSVRGFRGSITV